MSKSTQVIPLNTIDTEKEVPISLDIEDEPLLNQVESNDSNTEKEPIFGTTNVDSEGVWWYDKDHRKKRGMTWRANVCLSLYWFGWSVLWLPLLVIIMPLQVVKIAGEEGKGGSLGSTLLAGSLSSLVTSPLFGAISDRCQNAMGRRRPFMIVGGGLVTVGLLMMCMSKSIAFYSISFLIVTSGNSLILSPYSALVPDIVPSHQRGVASGFLGVFSMLGYLIGGAVGYGLDVFGLVFTYIVVIILHDGALYITVRYTEEIPITPDDSDPKLDYRTCFNGFLEPFKSHDFRYVLFTRFLIQMGCTTVLEFLQYYLHDAIGEDNYILNGRKVASTASSATSLLFIPLLCGAISSSLISGFVSDYIGKRKIIVYISGAIMGFSCVMLAMTRSFALDVPISLIFGIGYGAFSTIDWALATDTLPSSRDYGKDMGIWSMAMILPQVLAAPLAGVLLDIFQEAKPELNLGYSVIFVIAGVYYIIGTYLIKKVRSVK